MSIFADMKYLVAGLGNPGDEYSHTRHNIGFDIADSIAHACGTANSFKQARYAEVCEAKYNGKNIILIKPTTFMNLSGKAVKYWMDAEKITLENVWVLVDELALDFGVIRIKKSGSDGGHNGLKSLHEVLNTINYGRLRFGIGSNFPKGRQIEHVLGHWSAEEKKALPERIEHATNAILTLVHAGVDMAMNKFNNT